MKMDFKFFGRVGLNVMLMSMPFCAGAAVPEGAGIRGGLPAISLPEESIVNNSYFTESIRFNNLAKLAFADGDYDASFKFSMESIRIARSSDGYVTSRLKIAEANKQIALADTRLAQAAASKAETYFPKEYGSAKNFYNAAIKARDKEQWDDALNNAISAIEILADVCDPAPAKDSEVKVVDENKTVDEVQITEENKNEKDEKTPLPAQYTVRPWETSRDCFWNISARSWVYNDPYRWPVLYRANKHKLSDPNNPNLIKPGLVIDIPSINGEVRQGMWNAGKKYSPLR